MIWLICSDTYYLDRLVYNRASDDDWNRYANITGDPGWSAESILPYYFKVLLMPHLTQNLIVINSYLLFMQSSRLVPPADNHNTSGQVNPAVHGYGPIEVSLNGFPMDFDGIVANASRELEGQFKFNEDIQSGDTTGISELFDRSNSFFCDLWG